MKKYRVKCFYQTTLINNVLVNAESLNDAEAKAREEFEERNSKWEKEGGFPQTLIKVMAEDA